MGSSVSAVANRSTPVHSGVGLIDDLDLFVFVRRKADAIESVDVIERFSVRRRRREP
jgi:hypothetical protein